MNQTYPKAQPTRSDCIVLTGASGGVGSRTLRGLLELGSGGHVTALARAPERLPQLPGVAVRIGDYDDPASLAAAFAGAGTLLFISSDGPREVIERHHRNVLEAARQCGVGRIVYTSILDVAPDSPFYYAPVHRETEALVRTTAPSSTILRTSVFADFFLLFVREAIASGVFAVPAGEGRVSLVTRDDVGAMLARAAMRSDNAVLRVAGPEALSLQEIASIVSERVGRPIAYRPPPPARYAEALRQAGRPDWIVQAFTSMFAAVAEGRFAEVSEDFQALVGRPPQRFADFLCRAFDRAASPGRASDPAG